MVSHIGLDIALPVLLIAGGLAALLCYAILVSRRSSGTNEGSRNAERESVFSPREGSTNSRASDIRQRSSRSRADKNCRQEQSEFGTDWRKAPITPEVPRLLRPELTGEPHIRSREANVRGAPSMQERVYSANTPIGNVRNSRTEPAGQLQGRSAAVPCRPSAISRTTTTGPKAALRTAEAGAIPSPRLFSRKNDGPFSRLPKNPLAEVLHTDRARAPVNLESYLRQIIEPLGGKPGSITASQQIVVQSLLLDSAPVWMSERQASVLLSVRYCCGHILAGVMGKSSNAPVNPIVLRRLVIRVVSDPALRDKVMQWDAQTVVDSYGNPIYRNRDPRTVRLIERYCRRILNEAGIPAGKVPKLLDPKNGLRDQISQSRRTVRSGLGDLDD